MMAADQSRVDSLIQFAILVAGEEDDLFDRQLGPIHLIKYVYLADLAYAARHAGETFTGIEWQFYKFGPWSQAVNERIATALSAIGANQFNFQSDFEDGGDVSRWSCRDDDLLQRKRQTIPPEIRLQLEPQIRRFGKDTPRLLDFVYRTAPMVEAAPMEMLDFKIAVVDNKPSDSSPASAIEALSGKKKKRLKEQLAAIQKKVAERAANGTKLINPVQNRRYDEVFQDGVTWLETLAGDELSPGEKIAEFTDEVWKSNARKGRDVS